MKTKRKSVCVSPLTGCRFLFSLWFCSMIFKSCSPRSILSAKEWHVDSNTFYWSEEEHCTVQAADQCSSCPGWRGWEESAVKHWVWGRKGTAVLDSKGKSLQENCLLGAGRELKTERKKDFHKPSSSDEALLSPHSALTSFNMRLNLLFTLGSRNSAWVLDGNFLFGGQSSPLWTANSRSSYDKEAFPK